MIESANLAKKKGLISYLKKVMFIFSLFLIVLVGREFLELYVLSKSVHPALGYAYLFIVIVVLIFFVILPAWKFIRIPKRFKHVKSPDLIDAEISRRLVILEKNPFLRKINYDFSNGQSDRERYDKIIDMLSEECANIRKKYQLWLLISTAAAQNGFLDAILILSANVNMVKEIFILYNNRVTNRNLFAICKHLYFSVAIGGSQIIEMSIGDIVAKFVKDMGGDIPLFGKVVASASDGFINAVLLARVSLITENYCKAIHIKSRRDLYPPHTFIISVARDLPTSIMTYLGNKLSKSESPEEEQVIRRNIDIEVSPKQLFCGQCGIKLGEDFRFCSTCGVEILGD